MLRVISTGIGIAAILLYLSHPALAQKAYLLHGIQPRTINQDLGYARTAETVFQTHNAKVISSADGINRRARLGERIYLVRDRQGENGSNGVFPQGSLNNEDAGDAVQVEYQLNRNFE